jgi:hypothetical protein
MKFDHAPKPDGAKPPACAVVRGGQVPAIPCARTGPLPRSAIRLPHATSRNAMLLWRVPRAKAERMQNPLESLNCCGSLLNPLQVPLANRIAQTRFC